MGEFAIDERTVLFFIAGTAPTATEQGLIDRIRGNVIVMTAADATKYNPTYGGNLKTADALAGSIPTAYKTGAGTTIDTALYPDGDVTPEVTAYPEAFKVYPATLAIKVGEIKDLSAVSGDLAEDTDVVTLTNKAAAVSVDWTSSDETKATVDTDGKVTGVAAGTSTITATYTYAGSSTITSTCVVTVSTASVENVLVMPSTVSVAALGTVNLFAAEAKSDGTVSNVTATTGAWSSSDPTKASINADTGVVTGAAGGQTTVTFTKGGKTSTCVVTCTG